MWCVIPVAGRATRLAARTGGGPKALLPLGDRSLIEHLVSRLGPRVKAACLVCSPEHRDAFRTLLGEERGGIRLHYAVQPLPGGVADAVGRAADHVEGAFLVVMGDGYFDASLADFVSEWSAAGTDGAVLVERADEAGGQPMGLVEAPQGRIERIFKAPWSGQLKWRVCGAYLMPHAYFQALRSTEPGGSGELELEGVVTILEAEGLSFAAIPYGGWRKNINTPADLDEVRRRIAPERRSG